ncbi:uncharacterized protein DUF938 [Alteromonadaceae bacterium 2753L.S.0a.02]|nr:uncharacterized protein DUF938 [Alteromonadaceae bacterium 2753L.S.0a.02]
MVDIAAPISQACENNKAPILEVLRRVFDHSQQVMEIGSGTGQHAAWFAQHLPHLVWQPTDVAEHLAGIELWRAQAGCPNLKKPLPFNIHDSGWPLDSCDAVFSANTAHIMSWPTACLMIKRVAEHLPTGGVFALYGPFNYHGTYTSESNQNFDVWLKEQDPVRAIRDFEKVDQQARNHGLNLFEDNAMPANNRLLVWVKS